MLASNLSKTFVLTHAKRAAISVALTVDVVFLITTVTVNSGVFHHLALSFLNIVEVIRDIGIVHGRVQV